MKIFSSTSQKFEYASEIFSTYFKDKKIGFFDIETTGLSPKRSKLILAGLAVYSGDEIVSHQFLAENPSEEPLVINALLDELRKLDMVITYNGKSFDIPFLLERCQANKILVNNTLPYNLDLYRAVKDASPLKGILPNLKQKTVEDYTGLWETRTDEISGADSVDLYYHYASTGDEKIRDLILLHNRDDIVQLSRLIKVLDKCDLNKVVYLNGMPVDNDLIINSIKIGKNYLDIQGTQRYNAINGLSYDDFCLGHKSWFNADDSSFTIRTPITVTHSLVLLDLKAISLNYDSLSGLPNIKEDYLIATNDGYINYREVNLFSRIITSETQKIFIK